MSSREPPTRRVTNLSAAWRRRMTRARAIRKRLNYDGVKRRPRPAAKRRMLEERDQLNSLE